MHISYFMSQLSTYGSNLHQEKRCFGMVCSVEQVSCVCGFPRGSDSKASAHNAGNPGSIPRSGRSSGEGNGNPLQYSCLDNPMDGGAW